MSLSPGVAFPAGAFVARVVFTAGDCRPSYPQLIHEYNSFTKATLAANLTPPLILMSISSAVLPGNNLSL